MLLLLLPPKGNCCCFCRVKTHLVFYQRVSPQGYLPSLVPKENKAKVFTFIELNANSIKLERLNNPLARTSYLLDTHVLSRSFLCTLDPTLRVHTIVSSSGGGGGGVGVGTGLYITVAGILHKLTAILNNEMLTADVVVVVASGGGGGCGVSLSAQAQSVCWDARLTETFTSFC